MPLSAGRGVPAKAEATPGLLLHLMKSNWIQTCFPVVAEAITSRIAFCELPGTGSWSWTVRKMSSSSPFTHRSASFSRHRRTRLTRTGACSTVDCHWYRPRNQQNQASLSPDLESLAKAYDCRMVMGITDCSIGSVSWRSSSCLALNIVLCHS